MNNLNQIISHFSITGTVADVKPLGNGLINDTYKITTAEADAPDYVLQRINDSIFTDVDLLQHNIEEVTTHIRELLVKEGADDIDRRVLTFIKADNGKTYIKDEEGKYWRISMFIPDAVTVDAVNPESSYHAGKAFGKFESQVADITDRLGETIPDFHNMELRRDQLRQAVKDDRAGRAAGVKDFIDEIEKYMDEMCLGERLFREGKLQKHVCHCDTKVNNMMFDKQGRVLCVIDLDTVMPSLFVSDYGDFLRTAANTIAEDSPSSTRLISAWTSSRLSHADTLSRLQASSLRSKSHCCPTPPNCSRTCRQYAFFGTISTAITTGSALIPSTTSHVPATSGTSSSRLVSTRQR